MTATTQTTAPGAAQCTALAIDARGVSKSYGRAVALRSVDLALAWGSVLALFGHNGAGKSTLLRILATLAKPSQGSVAIARFDSRSRPQAARASIGYAGHHDLLYDDLTPAENLLFYARLYGVPNPNDRVERALADVAAEGWAHRRARDLSNGMRKRVAIARALLHQPPILLLDEPDAGLDIEAQRLVDSVIGAVASSGGSVILTTHDPQRGLAVAAEYAVLRSGRLTARGLARDAAPAGIAALLSGNQRDSPDAPPPQETPPYSRHDAP